MAPTTATSGQAHGRAWVDSCAGPGTYARCLFRAGSRLRTGHTWLAALTVSICKPLPAACLHNHRTIKPLNPLTPAEASRPTTA